MNFAYQARNRDGEVQSGEITANDQDEAAQQLRRDGLYVMSIKEDSGPVVSAGLSIFQKKIKRDDIIYLTNQLSVMVDAGVPLATALDGLQKQGDNPTMQAMLKNLQNSVESGEDFSHALSRYPKYFDTTYVNLIKASGTMSQMLDRIAIQSRTELETKQKVKGAMMYPAAMLVMCIGVSIFLLIYVFPKLTPMFEAKQIEVPGPTKVMMALSDALINYWYLFIIAVIALVSFYFYARKKIWGRCALDWFWLNVPVLGPLCRKATIGRSLKTLATTVNAGVPMLDALKLCAAVSGNYFYERLWKMVGEEVVGGKQIHEALDGNKLIPATILQMISSGESTGRLGQVLDKVSEYFEREVANTVKSVSSLIEPIMVAVMGAVIGTIALAMLLPIFKLSTGH